MLEYITDQDSFRTWREKFNAIIDAQTDVVSFNIDTNSTNNLDLYVLGGKVRENSEVNEINQTVLVLEPNATNYVGIDLTTQYNPILVSGVIDDKPSDQYIHLYEVVTSLNTINNVTDLRTIFSAADASSNTADQLAGVTEIERSIFASITLDPTKNAFSVSPTIEDGVTVTVTDGCIWSII